MAAHTRHSHGRGDGKLAGSQELSLHIESEYFDIREWFIENRDISFNIP
jgi:hypothetical protein